MTYVLDACALIARIKNEPGADVVEGLLCQAVTGEADLCINIVNLVEVYYGFMKEFGEERAREIMRTVYDTAVEVIDTTDGAVFEEVARLKSTLGKFSLADSFGLATASVLGGTFVTCDHHKLGKFEGQVNIPFLWIRPIPQYGNARFPA
jgi:predicted nucleic acid-binding protein